LALPHPMNLNLRSAVTKRLAVGRQLKRTCLCSPQIPYHFHSRYKAYNSEVRSKGRRARHAAYNTPRLNLRPTGCRRENQPGLLYANASVLFCSPLRRPRAETQNPSKNARIPIKRGVVLTPYPLPNRKVDKFVTDVPSARLRKILGMLRWVSVERLLKKGDLAE